MRSAPVISAETGDAQARRVDFDDLARFPARRISAGPAKPEEIEALFALASHLIPPLAAAEGSVREVYRHNPESIWAVHGRTGLAGVFAMLLLNDQGLNALLAGSFDASRPDTSLLTRPGEPAAAIYFWAIATPGFAIDAFRVVSRWLQMPPYASADIFTRGSTSAGTRFAVTIGFKPFADLGLYRYRRQRNRSEPETAVA